MNVYHALLLLHKHRFLAEEIGGDLFPDVLRYPEDSPLF